MSFLSDAVQPWFASFADQKCLHDAIQRAVTEKRFTEITYAVASRNDRGRLPSRLVGSRSIDVTIYEVRLPDSWQWLLCASPTAATERRANIHRAPPLVYESQGPWEALSLYSFTRAELAQAIHEFGMDALSSALTKLLDHPRLPSLYRVVDGGGREEDSTGIRSNSAIAAAVMHCLDGRRGKLEERILNADNEVVRDEEWHESLLTADRERALEVAVRFNKKLQQEDYSLRPVKELFMEPSLFRQLLAREKTVESRRFVGDYAKVKPGWLLCFRQNDSSLCIWREVTEVTRHDSFVEAFDKYGAALLSTQHAESRTRVDFEFFQVYTRSYPISVATWRRWAGMKGSIVCWRLHELPNNVLKPAHSMYLLNGRGGFEAVDVFQRFAVELQFAQPFPARWRRKARIVRAALVEFQRKHKAAADFGRMAERYAARREASTRIQRSVRACQSRTRFTTLVAMARVLPKAGGVTQPTIQTRRTHRVAEHSRARADFLHKRDSVASTASTDAESNQPFPGYSPFFIERIRQAAASAGAASEKPSQIDADAEVAMAAPTATDKVLFQVRVATSSTVSVQLRFAKEGTSEGGAVEEVIRGAGIGSADLLGGNLAVDAFAVIADCVSANLNAEHRVLQLRGCVALPRLTAAAGNKLFSVKSSWRELAQVTQQQAEGMPCVFTMHAQWGPGAPQRRAQPEGKRDGIEQRAAWLKQCLEQIAIETGLQEFKTIAFSAEQFEEPLLYQQLKAFAAKHHQLRVLLVKKPENSIKDTFAGARKDILEAERGAREFIKEHCRDDSFTKVIAEALCAAMSNQLQATLTGEEEDREFAKTLPTFETLAGREASAAFTQAFTSSAAGLPEVARRQLVEANREVARSVQLIDARYREQREKQFRDGLVTLEELEEEAALNKDMSAAVDKARAASPRSGVAEAFLSHAGLSTGNLAAEQKEQPGVQHEDHLSLLETIRTRGDKEGAPRIRVSSADGKRTPCRLNELYVVDESKVVAIRHRIFQNIFDTGSGITFFGSVLASKLVKLGALRYVTPLPSSVERIRGIGAGNRVLNWVAGTIELGGELVDLEDSPVLAEIEGILLGNDFMAATRARIENMQWEGNDGCVTLMKADGTPLSRPVGFKTTPDHQLPRALFARAEDLVEGEAALAEPVTPHSKTHLQLAVAADGTVRTKLQVTTPREVTAQVKRVIGEVAPLGYAPDAIEIEPWCVQYIKVRLPCSMPVDRSVGIVPVEDPMLPDLGVLIAPTIEHADADGYVWVKVMNPTRRSVQIPLLRPVVRFIIDPELVGPVVEFTSEEVMQKIKIGPQTEKEREKCRVMLEKRLSLFRTTLGYTQTPRIDIVTPAIDRGEVEAPAEPAFSRPPQVEAVLEEKVQSLYQQDIVEPANRSPYNARMLPLRKPDGSIRPATDYRKVNPHVERDTFPLPNIEANLNALGRARWFTVLDLLQGFLQCELTLSARRKTAFTVNGRQWQYKRLPMGLTTSPSAFMRVVDAALQGLPPGIAFAFV